jgi:hypothetical protein
MMAANVDDLYKDAKVQGLVKTKPMLKGLDKLLYVHLREAIKDVQATVPPYNPYLYEPLLADSSKLLDKCLAYRRECLDLESQAVRRALEYQLFTELAEDERSLNSHLTNTSALSAHATAQTNAASGFMASDNDLRPFGALYAGGATAAQEAIDNEARKRTTLDERLNKLAAHQVRLELRHTTPGHALNYQQRRERVIELIKQDLSEAFQKSRAARAGILGQLGLGDNEKYPFPVITDSEADVHFLDQLVLWLRDLLRRYELDTSEDVIFERTIPLVQPHWHDGVTEKRLVEKESFKAKMNDRKDGLVSLVDLGSVIPKAFRRVRVRGVALSAGWLPASRDTEGASFLWSALVFFPSQPDPYKSAPESSSASARPVVRVPAVLGRIGVFRSDSLPAYSTGEEVWNADPTTGTLQVLVEPSVVTADDDKTVSVLPSHLAYVR